MSRKIYFSSFISATASDVSGSSSIKSRPEFLIIARGSTLMIAYSCPPRRKEEFNCDDWQRSERQQGFALQFREQKRGYGISSVPPGGHWLKFKGCILKVLLPRLWPLLLVPRGA